MLYNRLPLGILRLVRASTGSTVRSAPTWSVRPSRLGHGLPRLFPAARAMSDISSSSPDPPSSPSSSRSVSPAQCHQFMLRSDLQRFNFYSAAPSPPAPQANPNFLLPTPSSRPGSQHLQHLPPDSSAPRPAQGLDRQANVARRCWRKGSSRRSGLSRRPRWDGSSPTLS